MPSSVSAIRRCRNQTGDQICERRQQHHKGKHSPRRCIPYAALAAEMGKSAAKSIKATLEALDSLTAAEGHLVPSGIWAGQTIKTKLTLWFGPARRRRARLFLAPFRQLDRRQIVRGNTGVAGAFPMPDKMAFICSPLIPAIGREASCGTYGRHAGSSERCRHRSAHR